MTNKLTGNSVLLKYNRQNTKRQVFKMVNMLDEIENLFNKNMDSLSDDFYALNRRDVALKWKML